MNFLLSTILVSTNRRKSFSTLVCIAILIAYSKPHAETLSLKADPNNTAQVIRGKIVYDRFCSLCHGKNLKGQKNWRRRKDNGRLPAPPHDETGHTWHHDDELLFGIVKEGLVPPYAPKGYESDMPGWKDTLKDSDIWSVLAYIKSRWPKKTQEISEEINADTLKNK